MIKKFKLIALSSLVTFSLLAMAGCKEECDNVLDGVYFLTGKGFKTYLERIAKAYDLDKSWVNGVLLDGDGGEYSRYIVSQESQYCVIIDNVISVEEQITFPYKFSNDGEKYTGSFLNYFSVSFYREENFLYVDGLQYKKDYRYKRNESLDYKLEPPRDMDNIYITKENVYFRYLPYEKDGWVGGTYEIKKANSENYEIVPGVDPLYEGDYVMDIDVDELSVGDNMIRIYHVGSAAATNKYEFYKTYDSDYVFYKITVDEEGISGVSKVEE